MRHVNIFLLFVAVAVVSGCTTFGVYESEFSCPASYNGQCVSLSGAYDLATGGKDNPESDPGVKHRKNDSPEKESVPLVEIAEAGYKESLYKRFDALLKEPVTPVVAPPQVMRILLLPYKGDNNELYMLRHAYFFVDEPRWILGDSLAAGEGEEE